MWSITCSVFYYHYPQRDFDQKEYKMFMRVSSILVTLTLVVMLAGCSESPTTQFEAGRAAIEKAQSEGLEQYAPELFKEATDSLNAATVEMEKQDGKFFAFRSYGKAEELVTAAQKLAENANAKAVEEKERVRQQDSLLIGEIDSLLAFTNGLLAKAPKGKGSRVDLKVMQSDLDAASGALTLATEAYKSGGYLVANEKLQAVKAQVGKVKTDIESAIANIKK